MDLINIGQIANDGTGDDLREAFIKVNQNFEELDLREPESTEVANLGGGQELFKSKNASTLNFRTLDAGDNITLTTDGNVVRINSLGGLQALTVEADSGGTLSLQDGDTFRVTGTGATTTIDNGALSIDSVVISTDTAPSLGGNLDASGRNITDANVIDATTFIGGLNGNVYGIDVRQVAKYSTQLDFGTTIPNITNFMDYLVATIDVDYGSILSPAPITTDLGSL